MKMEKSFEFSAYDFVLAGEFDLIFIGALLAFN